jgi:hypothetical protein
MSQITTVTATDDQVKKILKRLRRVYGLHYSFDSEDNIGFVWCTTSFWETDHQRLLMLGHGVFQWQVNGGEPIFFSFQRDGIAYDVVRPTGKLYKRLKKLSDKAEHRFWKGGQI